MMELVISRGSKDLLSLPLEDGVVRIGRAGTNDLSLPEPTVSRHQCQIFREEDEIRLRDCSGKGTWVDGKRVQETTLRSGSNIQFGTLTGTLRERSGREYSSPTLSGGGTEVLPGMGNSKDSLFLAGRVGGKRLRLPLAKTVINVGSDPGNDLVLKDSFVSAFHCRFYRKGQAWQVIDLDSTNGTMVNNVRVGEARLEPGSTVTLGQATLRVEREEAGPDAGGFSGILSADAAMKPVFERIRRAAPTDETILVTGESGSGKELVARALHTHSRRSGRSMVALNCAAITKDLLESELFGHEKGAFTGAQSQRKGLFEEADGGTLFLDEIGELALDVQAKLLRTLESGEIRRVGSNTPRRVDVRVIAATHRSLPERVQSGDFREDLYYRICVIEIEIPPLRKRPADIPLLAESFLSRATRHTEPRSLSEGALRELARYRYPGNVRELKHVITRAAILSPQSVIEAKDLAFAPPTLADRVAESRIYRKGKTLKEVEIESIRQTLAAHDGNQKAAARVLGIARSTLIHKMDKYGICAKLPIPRS